MCAVSLKRCAEPVPPGALLLAKVEGSLIFNMPLKQLVYQRLCLQAVDPVSPNRGAETRWISLE